MNYNLETTARAYASGMGEAVANRTINRKIDEEYPTPETIEIFLPRDDHRSLDSQIAAYCKSNNLLWKGDYTVVHGDGAMLQVNVIVTGRTRVELWEDVAKRVAKGNALLHNDELTRYGEDRALHYHLRRGSIIMSGRHLQHGDETQPTRPQEVFTNCSTSAASFLTFYLLLNGSGVGRSYDDDMMLADWNNMPIVVPVIHQTHKDVKSGEIVALSYEAAQHMYRRVESVYYRVPDSREGWAHAIEIMETMAFQKKRGLVLYLDFSDVRQRGEPIAGMQKRPASGPGPLIDAIKKIAAIRETCMDPWRAAMFVDHYLAECVLVGGARRAARMSTKHWKDKGILDFIQVKRGSFLWSSNNSVTIDAEFRAYIENPDIRTDLADHARAVMLAVCEAAYHDGTGEPGFINQDKLTENNAGLDDMTGSDIVGSDRFKLSADGRELMAKIFKAFKKKPYKMITNPCGEITLISMGGYCLIGDNAPYHAAPDWSPDADNFMLWQNQWDEEAEDSFKVLTRALIRTNTMNCLYRKEVNRTNRIGVSITGLHEYAYSRFGFGFRDLIDEEKSRRFWQMLSKWKRAVQIEARRYSAVLGVSAPHTDTTMKPAGTTSKLFGLTEAAHLPPRREYLRWVQFRNDDPLIREYEAKGYPSKKLETYNGTTVVGFPTQPEICKLDMGDALVLADEATPEEQFQWLRLLEKYWLRGVQEDGFTPLTEDTGNQISYTLKYDPKKVSFEQFMASIVKNQFTVKVCSVMPTLDNDTSAYEYLPEQMVTKAEFEMIVNAINEDDVKTSEDVSFEHIDCGSGGCPVDFSEESVLKSL